MYKCPKCGAELQEGQEVCNCGTKITWQKPQEQSAQTTPSEMPIETLTGIPTETPKHNKMAEVLSGIAAFLMIIGCMAGLLLIVIYEKSIGIGISVFAVSIISGVFMLGFAEIIQLLQDIKSKLK